MQANSCATKCAVSADEQGAEVPPVSPGADLVPLIGEWCGLADHLLTQAAELTDNDRASLIDLFDGRLWHFMYLCTAIGQPIGLPSHAMQVAERLFHAICQPSGLSEAQVSSFVVNQPLAVASGTALNGHEAPAANEPAFMTNPLINVFFGLQAEDLAVPEHQPEAASTAAQELQVFHDNFHWHTGVPIEPSYIGETQRANLLAEYQGANVYRMAECPHLSAGQRARARQVIRQQTDPLLWRQDPRERARQLTEAAQKAYAQLKVKLDKQQQLNARFLQRYGATMDATKYCMPNPAAQEAARSSRRAQSIISKNTANLRARAWSERHMQWSAVQLELQRYAERNNDCWDSYMVSRLVDFLEDGVERGISTDTFLAAQCFRLQGELNAWKKQCRKLHASVNASGPAVAAFENTPEHMLHAVNIWNTVQALLASGRLTRPEPAPANTSQAAVEAVAATGKAVRQALRLCKQAMQQLGFEHAADRIQTLLSALDPERRSRSRPASASAASSELCKVGMTETEFQLRFCGDVLQRSAPDAPDPRVVSFNPDAWQRRVLDAIDASESCVMCAPTSSGKTFISSFCMDRVLKSPDGIVVFVAPTKALVNQTAAQVCIPTMANCSASPVL